MLAEPGFHTRCWVEFAEYPRSCIIAAQRAGYFAPAPIWDDLTTFDGRPWRGIIDTITAGYPCQPFSLAGQRRGANDERHLWPHVARVIREVEPEWVILENVAGHVTLGLETVLRELWDMGWTPAAGIFSAGETGAPHERQRVFIVAYRPRQRSGEQNDTFGPEPWEDTWRSLGWGSRGFHCQLANPHGGNASPEREQRGGEQRGGEQRLFAADGPTRGEPAFTNVAHRDSEGCGWGTKLRSDGEPHPCECRADFGGCLSALGNPQSLGRGQGRPEPEFRRGRDTPTSTSCAMDISERDRCQSRWDDHRGYDGHYACSAGQYDLADTSGQRLQGRERPGSSGERFRPSAHGSTAECGGLPVHPPGPGNIEGWRAVLRDRPDLAPAIGRRGIVRAARTIAAGILSTAAEPDAQPGALGVAHRAPEDGVDGPQGGVLDPSAIEPAIRRMAHGLAARALALRAIGNGVHPLAAAHAWRSLAAAHGLGPVDMEAASKNPTAAEADEPVWMMP